MKVKSQSEFAQSCPTLVTSWTAAYQVPPSMGFSRQKYWSGVPLPSPEESKVVSNFASVSPSLSDVGQFNFSASLLVIFTLWTWLS